MVTTSPPSRSKKTSSIHININTPHIYLAEDSEFQQILRELTEEYIEKKQDDILRSDVKKSKKISELDALFLAKVGHT